MMMQRPASETLAPWRFLVRFHPGRKNVSTTGTFTTEIACMTTEARDRLIASSYVRMKDEELERIEVFDNREGTREELRAADICARIRSR